MMIVGPSVATRFAIRVALTNVLCIVVVMAIMIVAAAALVMVAHGDRQWKRVACGREAMQRRCTSQLVIMSQRH